MGFLEFCGNVQFWDQQLLLNNSWPEFTACFQQTALVWAPCGFLWLSALGYLPYLYHLTAENPGRVTWLNSGKIFLPFTLCLLSLVMLVSSLSDQSQVATSLYVAHSIKAATYLFCGILVYLERRKGLVTSGVQFLFWLLMLLANVIPFYTDIMLKDYQKNLFSFIMFCIQFFCILLVFVLQFFSEAGSQHQYRAIGEEDMSPEILASFPSRLTFCWAESLMRTGYKKALEASDLFTMSPQNQSRNIVPLFEAAWKREMERVNKINSKRTQEKASFFKEDNQKTPLLSGHKLQTQIPKDPTQTNSKSEPWPIPSANMGEQNQDPQGGQGRFQGDGQGQSTSGGGGTFPENGGPDGEEEISASFPNDGRAHPSLFRVLTSTHWVPFCVGQFLMLLYTLLQFVNPMVLTALLSYVSNRSTRPVWQGYVLACSFFVASFTQSFIHHQAMNNIKPLGMRLKSVVINAIYGKALTMSHESKRQSTVGQIVNLMSIDCQHIEEITEYLYLFWSMPLTIIIAMYQLWGILGAASLAGLVVMILVIPVNLCVVSREGRLRVSVMRTKDKRLRLMTEILNGIKMLKLYGWEPSFQEKILHHRKGELADLVSLSYIDSFITFVWTLVPYLVTLASFAAYVLTSQLGYLDSSKAFVSLSLFNIMQAPIGIIPELIPFLIQAVVSVRRVNAFLSWGDIDPDNVKRDPDSESVIRVERGTFTWDSTIPRPTLQNITMDVSPGKLVAVVGTVGCGKSSLLAAILGEMEKIKGTVTTKDHLAYVPQEAWIQNATVQDNILFGKPMSRRQYDQVVEACALESDFKILVGGDMTEIGEKGINLSGGQKQRVSLARAMYSEADTYLLDDPLSAVDSHVGKHIFQHVIGRQGLLANKTRILVTHGIHWLPMVDQIIVMDDGRISEVGSYEELLSRDGSFANFLRTFLNVGPGSDDEDEDEEEEDAEIRKIREGIFKRLESITSDGATSNDESKSLESSIKKRALQRQKSRALSVSEKVPAKVAPEKEDMSKLIEEEQSQIGSVKLSVYKTYIQALGTTSSVFILGLIVLYQASSFASSVWLTSWTSDSILANTSLAGTSVYNSRNAMYLGVYGGLGAAQAVFIMGFSILYNVRMVRATGVMHSSMLKSILRAPMSFFDTTPVGRIINRFSRDVDVMDFELTMTIKMFIMGAGTLLTTLILVAYSSPIFLTVLVPLAVIYKLVQMFYINTSRQLRRLESTSRSPVLTHFTETIQGATSIRAYGVSDRFLQEFQKRVDKNLVCYFAYVVANRWLGVRLEFLGSLVTLAAALFAVLNTSLSSSLVGLSVTYAMNVTNALSMIVSEFCEVETNIVSAERIKEYCETPTEAEWRKPDQSPGLTWPEDGCVEFKDFQMRYRPGLDLVLRNISYQVKGGEKIGIVGRTGAGKSSLTMALFRLTEAAGGSIVIDGYRIENLGLHDLRTRLTVLPQEPVIFSGTLRMNLDPTGKHTDDELWNALQLAHLRPFVSELPGQLEYECGEGGQNLSVGQRQLMCLARSVLRKSKILVLDEATAAVDLETDEVIQQTIRSEFKDSTVLTIAHRLKTIMDYDRILVLEEGKVKEFASPQELLSDPSTDFYAMAKAANLI